MSDMLRLWVKDGLLMGDHGCIAMAFKQSYAYRTIYWGGLSQGLGRDKDEGWGEPLRAWPPDLRNIQFTGDGLRR